VLYAGQFFRYGINYLRVDGIVSVFKDLTLREFKDLICLFCGLIFRLQSSNFSVGTTVLITHK